MALHRAVYHRSPWWNGALLVPLIGLAWLLAAALGVSTALGMLTLLVG